MRTLQEFIKDMKIDIPQQNILKDSPLEPSNIGSNSKDGSFAIHPCQSGDHMFVQYDKIFHHGIYVGTCKLNIPSVVDMTVDSEGRGIISKRPLVDFIRGSPFYGCVAYKNDSDSWRNLSASFALIMALACQDKYLPYEPMTYNCEHLATALRTAKYAPLPFVLPLYKFDIEHNVQLMNNKLFRWESEQVNKITAIFKAHLETSVSTIPSTSFMQYSSLQSSST